MSRRRRYRVLVSWPEGSFEIKETDATSEKGRANMAELVEVVRAAIRESLQRERGS